MPRRHTHKRSRFRRGALESLELIVGLPILILIALGAVHFGFLNSNLQSVAFASRDGALRAAETVGLPTNNGAPVPDMILTPIRTHLLSAGIENFVVQVEHNVGINNPVVLESTVGTGVSCAPLPHLNGVPLPYVRVIVCTRLDELTPDVMKVLGFSIAGPDKLTHHSSVMCYEPPF